MYTAKLRTGLLVTILSTILFSVSAMALFTEYYTIPTSGSISSTIVRPSGLFYESEIRAVFIHGENMWSMPNWELIADTLKSYNVNTIIVEALYPHGSRYPSAIVPSYTADMLTPAINAAHARGMKIHASFNVLLGAYNDAQKTMAADGTLRDWTSPVKAVSRAHIKALTQEMASFKALTGSYAGDTLDGFMLDYIRYGEGMTDTPYEPEATAKFQADTGNVFSDAFKPGGARYDEYMEWRTIPISELVRDMRSWILEVNPNMKISAAVWPTYSFDNRYWLGQDTIYWIQQGWLDWVAPMFYVGTGDSIFLGNLVKEIIDQVGGPEGKIPVAPFLTHVYISKTPQQFKAEIDAVRANGGDGWSLWRYGGPGDGSTSAADIRSYLSIMSLPTTFSIRKLNVLTSSTSVTITWETTSPATTRVEYNSSLLYTISKEIRADNGHSYWDIDKVPGIVVENAPPTTTHSVQLTGLVPNTTYYYQIQSNDSSGTATSTVLTFYTS